MNEQLPQSLLKKLEAHVTMRPKWRFWLEHTAIAMAIVLVAVGLVYLASFLTYLWRAARFSDLPSFGSAGTRLLIRAFPWWEIGIIGLGGVAFFFLIRRHTKLYRWPLVAIIGVFVGAFIIGAAVTNSTRLHDRLANRSFERSLPIIGPLYHWQRPLVQGLVTAGRIQKIKGKTLTLLVDGEKLTVKTSDGTRTPLNWDPTVGEYIVVIGQRKNDEIKAEVIQPTSQLPSPRLRRYRLPPDVIQFQRIETSSPTET